MKKFLTRILVLVIAIVGGLLTVQDVWAGGGATPGTDPTGGSCGDWWDTCYGYTWQKYYVNEDFPKDTVSLHTTESTGSRVFINGCKAGQYVYNYGLEVHHSGYYGYQVSTQKNKNGKQAPWASVALGSFPGSLSTIGKYTTPAGYVPMSVDQAAYENDRSVDGAENAFNAMMEYINVHRDEPFVGDTSMLFEQVGAFCFSPEARPEYLQVSNASATEGSKVPYKTTGIVQKTTEAPLLTVQADSGKATRVVFSHNLYSTMLTTKAATWTITRGIDGASSGMQSDGLTIEMDYSDGGNVSKDPTTSYSNQGFSSEKVGYYYPSYMNYAKVSNVSYIWRDVYNVTITDGKEHTLCETLISDKTNFSTKVCVKIKPSNGDAGKSGIYNAQATGEKYADSGEKPVMAGGDVDKGTLKATLSSGGEDVLVFTHNAYAKSASKTVNWSVRRTVTVTMSGSNSSTVLNGFSTNNYYTITRINGPLTFPAVYNGSSITGLTADSNGFYAAAQNYTDNKGDKFLMRDEFRVKFKRDGNYKFCETLTVNGSQVTEVCKEIKVGDGGGNDCLNGECPDKYFGKSGVYNGNTDEYADTGIVNSLTAKNLTASLQLPNNGTVSDWIVFTHNAYAKDSGDDVVWSIVRAATVMANGTVVSNSSDYYSISPSFSSSGNTTGKASVADSGYYALPKNYGPDNKGEYYLSRGSYTVTFKKAGTYKFCESLTVNGTRVTEVCKTITVTNPPSIDLQLCTTWTPATYTSSSSTSGTTSVTTRVNNASLAGSRQNGYSDWKGDTNYSTALTYARPGDNVQWMSCYYPGVQKTAKTNEVTADCSHINYSTCTPTTKNVYQVKSPWDNKFTITSTVTPTITRSAFGANPASGSYDPGVSTVRASGNSYQIYHLNDVGKTFNQTITSGGPTKVTLVDENIKHRTTVPCENGPCYFYYHGSRFKYYVESPARVETAVTSSAEVKIPYNFSNSTSVSMKKEENEPVYAGESVNVNTASVTVGVKSNSVTGSSAQNNWYATQVDGAKVQLVAYVSSYDESEGSKSYDLGGSGVNLCTVGNWATRKQCTINAQADNVVLNYRNSVAAVLAGGTEGNNDRFRTLSSNGSSTVNTGDVFVGDYTVFDADAGDYMCFAMAVWPATSGSDTNLEASGDNKWAISKTCRVIAKKPSFQIYGGSLYANGIVSAIPASKYNILGVTYNISNHMAVNTYSTDVPGKSTIFGSVVEQSIVGLSAVTGVASGASTGLANGLSSPAKGSLENGSGEFCKYRTALSIANFSNDLAMCPTRSETTGFAGTVYSTTDRASLVNYWLPESDASLEKYTDSSVTVGNSTGKTLVSATGRNIRYVYKDGALTINGGQISKNTTYIIKVNGDVDINGDLTYANESYGSTGEIPKTVIYATGNIKISCGVNAIDAILIAGNGVSGGKVKSCGDFGSVNTPLDIGDANDQNRTRQLNIRGAVIADELILGRTYGAAAGAESGIPAEAINYDASAILWGRYMAGAGESDTLTVTYQHELAPRY